MARQAPNPSNVSQRTLRPRRVRNELNRTQRTNRRERRIARLKSSLPESATDIDTIVVQQARDTQYQGVESESSQTSGDVAVNTIEATNPIEDVNRKEVAFSYETTVPRYAQLDENNVPYAFVQATPLPDTPPSQIVSIKVPPEFLSELNEGSGGYNPRAGTKRKLSEIEDGEEKIGVMETCLNAKFREVDRRLDRMEEKMKSMEKKMDRIIEVIAKAYPELM